MSTSSAFVGLSWSALRSLSPARAPNGPASATLERDGSHETTVGFVPALGRAEVHGHGGSETWLHVIAGEVEEERWTKVGSDWTYEARILRPGESSTLPADALHRVRAIADATVLTVYTPAPAVGAERVPWSLMPALRAARWRAGRDAEGEE